MSPLVAPGFVGMNTKTASGRQFTAVKLPEVRFHPA
jgi:hypothetical protein